VPPCQRFEHGNVEFPQSLVFPFVGIVGTG
jgi:hypothetical protein